MAFWNENSDERRRREDDNSSQNDRRGGFSFNEGNSFDERYSRGEFGDSSEDRERGRDRGYRGYGRRLDDIQPIREDLTGDLPPIGNPASVPKRSAEGSFFLSRFGRLCAATATPRRAAGRHERSADAGPRL